MVSTKVLRRQSKVDKYNHQYTMNIYKGCSYGCVYCYSTQPCGYNGYSKTKPILTTPTPKNNIIQDLQDDLQKLQNIPSSEKDVQIGNTWDVYPLIEKNHQLTRQCLDVFTNYPDWRVYLETKSPLITRDIDILKKLPHFEAQITITTHKHDKYWEPNAPSTKDRLDAIEQLVNNGISVCVFICPNLGKDFTNVKQIKQLAGQKGVTQFHERNLRYFKVSQLRNKYNIPLIPMQNDYDLFDGLSFLQKNIREGNLDDALYWGYYLALDYSSQLWNRLRIMTFEDIGLVNPEAVIVIDELHKQWKTNKNNQLWISAIKYLCDSDKNREVDSFLIVSNKGGKNKKPKIYTTLLDVLTNITKDEIEQFGEMDAFYYYEQAPTRFWNDIKSICSDQFILSCELSYNQITSGERGFVSLVILYLSRRINNTFTPININQQVSQILNTPVTLPNYQTFQPTIKPYYYDMHTYKGVCNGYRKGTQKGFKHWFGNIKLNKPKPIPFGNVWDCHLEGFYKNYYK